MIAKFTTDIELYNAMQDVIEEGESELVMIELSKSNCYQLHRLISTEFDCVCEDLTWNNDLIFNTETFTHKDMYENLFKLKFKGVQLGQQ